MNKILFLDIDGVLNSDKFYESRPKTNIDMHAVELINSLDIKDLKIVISSSYGEDGKKLLENLIKFPIIDWTEHYSLNYDWICRGNEILKWLQDNGYNASTFAINDYAKYCIVDDNDDMLMSQKDKFVQVDSEVGLTEKDIEKIKNILKDYEIDG